MVIRRRAKFNDTSQVPVAYVIVSLLPSQILRGKGPKWAMRERPTARIAPCVLSMTDRIPTGCTILLDLAGTQ